jgi:hypothetical protein
MCREPAFLRQIKGEKEIRSDRLIPAKNADVPTTADADLASAVNHYGTLKETLGAITLGVLSWLMLGLLPMLLGALEDEGRMTLAQIGLAFPCLTLSMGIVSTGAGILLKRRYLRCHRTVYSSRGSARRPALDRHWCDRRTDPCAGALVRNLLHVIDGSVNRSFGSYDRHSPTAISVHRRI